MKVLAISDIHKNEYAIKKTMRLIEDHSPDLMLITGDITTFGPLEFAQEFLDSLPDLRTLVLPGNCDPPSILEIFESSRAESLHGKKVTISDVTFIGLGGSNSTPFNTPFELTEEEIFEKLDPIMEPGVILVLHFPIKGHLDLVSRGIETGSTSALKIVEKYRPSLVISGHIHETRGTETDSYGTKYVNPGQMQRGYYALIDIALKERINSDNLKYDCEIQLLE